MGSPLPISVVIPTYRREQVLLETIAYLHGLDHSPSEILVLDQTEQHLSEVEMTLRSLHDTGQIRWHRLAKPSITAAMNLGLMNAVERLVLFLDDDIRPEPELLDAHYRAHGEVSGALVAGRVIQPWEEGVPAPNDGEFRFSGQQPQWISEFMGGNFSVDREQALAIEGFDENFVKVAYRFEAEFAFRWQAAGNRIRFVPEACLHHLKAMGGTRTFGDHQTTIRPDHAVGAYYFALRTKGAFAVLGEFLLRPLRAVSTRHHLRQPWWIPVSLVAEVRGMLWAIRLRLAGPRYAGRRG